ncbi:MAG: erythromycin esterase family protein [Bryobacteraceae bacterium]
MTRPSQMRKKQRFLPCILLALAVAPYAWSADDQPAIEWMRANAIRLATPEAGHGFADMQPLKQVVGNARIVALGEATHGTREFFQLKHRMLEFLATEMGFTIFSIEANMPEAYRLNDYVLNGNGDPKKLLKGMYFWTWDTEEVLDMIRWMREFNKSGKGRVEFTGFDMQTPTVAMKIVQDFVAKNDPDYSAALRLASDQASHAQQTSQGANFGFATANFPVKEAAGKRVHYSGYIKTEGITRGYAGLWWRVDGASGILAFDNMQDRGVTGTTDWKKYDIDLPVAAGAININFGALLTGDGSAWFDGLAVELDGKPYADAGLLDLDFENSAKGFFTGGNGYQVRPDDTVFHSGKHSLQMKYVGGAATPSNATDAKIASVTWSGVVRHLEGSREVYRKGAATAADIEWAIQNARVVLQAMQMKANQVTRDESMARNIKWILDNSPKAKIVVWAHNGHVGTATSGAYRSMGSWLREMYGDNMVIFGFAFNQGSFQAVETGKRLRDFTVPPAHAGSLDATLAATGIPLFALDLRPIPKTGPVAAWWNEPHLTRSIGAVFSESAAHVLFPLIAPRTYDALLFVEKTTAARKNLDLGVKFDVRAAGDSKEYRDSEYGVAFTLPPGWSVSQAQRWGNRETTVFLNATQSEATAALYFRVAAAPEKISPDEIRQKLRSETEAKVAQRATEGLAGYRIRPDSYQYREINGRQALACVADYTLEGRAMAEYLVYARSGQVLALFFARMPAGELDRFRERFDTVANSLTLPQ